MKTRLFLRWPLALVLCLPILAACGLLSTWHWERPGADEADYKTDEIQCKGRAYSGTDGAVTKEGVRRMHACMEAKGWRKVQN